MKLKITVHGVPYEVEVEVLDASDEMQQQSGPLPTAAPRPTAPSSLPPAPAPMPAPAAPAPAAAGQPGSVTSPIAGTVLELKCKQGDSVEPGQPLVVIEAMKMETVISAPSSGTVKAVLVAAGDSVRESQALVELAG
ncbi:MAG: acetyl-CoA carboxylase biotin carboxyl carrier protein subunit [Planctomycetota bacterium]|nr:MAG: acetyl-CoA carboxylase biotin carboxyl carrier protein subunit [Planctomycetota bacterium]